MLNYCQIPNTHIRMPKILNLISNLPWWIWAMPMLRCNRMLGHHYIIHMFLKKLYLPGIHRKGMFQLHSNLIQHPLFGIGIFINCRNFNMEMIHLLKLWCSRFQRRKICPIINLIFIIVCWTSILGHSLRHFAYMKWILLISSGQQTGMGSEYYQSSLQTVGNTQENFVSHLNSENSIGA